MKLYLIKILEEKIDSIIINSLEPVQDLITSRKNSHETYGFDIMVDEDFNTWLLEINSSPCMDYSTVCFYINNFFIYSFYFLIGNHKKISKGIYGRYM